MKMSKKVSSTPSSGQEHARVNTTVIGRLEKKVLLWLAPRLPSWMVPDTLTGIGLFASLLIFISYALTTYDKDFLWLASFGFVLNWFGDSLDGTLARYRKIERPRYGFFIDHITDSISLVLIFIGLGLSPYLRLDLALYALISYLLGSIYVYLNTYVNGVFRLSYGGFSPTEFRLIAIATNFIVFFAGNPSVRFPTAGILEERLALTLFDLVVIGVILVILYLFLSNTITTARSLSREDRDAWLVKRSQASAERAAQRKALREERRLRKLAARRARSRALVAAVAARKNSE